MAAISNAQIMHAIDSLKDQMGRVEAQVIKTNGRVTTIEEWRNALLAVEKYKKENGEPTATLRWYQNKQLVGAVRTLILAAAGAIGYFAGTGAFK